MEAIAGVPPGRALDLACGGGRNSIALARAGWRVTAVDSSEVAVAIVRERAGKLPVDARVADLEKRCFHIGLCTWDLIVDYYYLQRELFADIRAGVRSGGLFVAGIHLTGIHEAFLIKPGELLREFSGWEILKYSEDGPEEGHRRRTAHLVARKP